MSAIVSEKCENRKLGKKGTVAMTMLGQQTCPVTCPFKGTGCYSESGPLGIHTRRLTRSGMSADECIESEALKIFDLKKVHLPLRLHVVGDVTTDRHALLLDGACVMRTAPVWTYTHSWREIDRASFGRISVLASCETTQDVRDANSLGYAAALVTDLFPGPRAYELDGLKVLPCPEQTTGRTCVECRLCMDSARLLRHGLTIGFAAHGARFKSALRQIGAAVQRRRYYKNDAQTVPVRS